nr:Lrp/AsnC family transcriptional regulator [Kibdelosporangium phytohabitans]
MDSIDREILFHLERDGRLSNVDLAERVGLTPPPCLRRVKRLEEQGVITGYRARINPAATGRPLEVIVSVEVAISDKKTLADLEATIAGYEEVIEFRRLFGTPDYHMRVMVADHEAYEHFQTEKIIGIPGVARVISHLTMKKIKVSD